MRRGKRRMCGQGARWFFFVFERENIFVAGRAKSEVFVVVVVVVH